MLIQIMLLGGKGLRFKAKNNISSLPKQFLPLANQQMVFCQSTLLLAKKIKPDVIILAVDQIYLEQDNVQRQLKIISQLNIPVLYCANGTTRSLSLANTLATIKRNYPHLDDATLVIHDANRPYLGETFLQRINETISICNEAKPCHIPVLAVSDSMVMHSETNKLTYVPREYYYKVQTPQIVYLKSLLKAKDKLTVKEWSLKTDEGSLMASCGFTIEKYQGDEMNQKITTQADVKQ